MLKEPDAPWAQADLPPIAAPEPVDAPGHAGMNPYVGTVIREGRESTDPGASTMGLAIFLGALLAVGAVIWRTVRH
jgi:hypothetical protein